VAIVKANYVKQGREERARAKASIRYIQHRRGKDEQTITRTLFGREGEMQRKDAYRIIDEASKGSFFYRFVISPDPKREDRNHDLDMRDITTQTIKALEDLIGRKEPIQWIAATHADHAPHLHTHVIAVVPKRLYKGNLEFLRYRATVASREQRCILDLAHYREREWPYPLQGFHSSHRPFSSFRKLTTRGMGGSRKPYTYQKPRLFPKISLNPCTCPRCFSMHIHSIRDPVHKCTSCGLILHRQQQLRIIKPAWEHQYHYQKGAAWER
jgi:hypothetical protein